MSRANDVRRILNKKMDPNHPYALSEIFEVVRKHLADEEGDPRTLGVPLHPRLARPWRAGVRYVLRFEEKKGSLFSDGDYYTRTKQISLI